MKVLFALVLPVFVSPLFEQQPSCSGKSALELNGATGCLFSITDANISHTEMLDSDVVRERIIPSIAVNAVMLDGFDKRWRTQRRRMLTLCNAVLGEVQKAAGRKKFDRIILNLAWPNEPVSRGRGGEQQSEVLIQSAFTNASCRSLGSFDRG